MVRRQPAGFQRGGFQGGPGPDGMPASYCRDNANLTLSLQQFDRATTHVRLDYSAPPGLSPCNADRMRMMDFDLLQFMPPLLAPEGAQQRSLGSSGGSNSSESYATIHTPLSVEDLLKHYADQLRSAGWTPGARAVATGAGIELWQLTKEGRDYQGLLTAIEQPDNVRTLSFRITAARD
jgi:hypothetical protein